MSSRPSRVESGHSRRSSRSAASLAATPAAITTINTTNPATDEHPILTSSRIHNILGPAALGVSPHTVQTVAGVV